MNNVNVDVVNNGMGNLMGSAAYDADPFFTVPSTVGYTLDVAIIYFIF